MDFLLPFTISKFPFSISYNSKILLIGSCFSREIGDRMASLKFNVLQNPNGILYNPLSIEKAINSYIQNNVYTEDELVSVDGVYHSLQHHSSFSGIEKVSVVEKINRSQNNAHHFLKQADELIITFGTAFSYQIKSSGEIVANCHKIPPENFEKRLLEISEIENEFLDLVEKLNIFNPRLKIIFTISPVKHVRDGVVENMQSKARLIEAVHYIISKTHNTYYFPSYELVTEVLRDYRFYKEDLVHPNNSATEFVFEKFCDSFFDNETMTLKKEVESINRMINHRPLFEESESHKAFKLGLSQKIEELKNSFPGIDFLKEN